MTRVSSVTLTREPAHHAVTIRARIDFMKEFATFADDAFTRTLALLADRGIVTAGGPIVGFHNTDLDRLDVEAGFRIAEPTEGAGDIVCSPVPVRTSATAVDLGPYEDSDPTLTDIVAWIAANGLTAQGPIYYVYLNETDRPEEQYLTQMLLPVEA